MKYRINTKKIFVAALYSLFVSNIYGQCLGDEQAFKDYFNKNISNLDPVEGIWSANSTMKIYNQYNQLVSSKYTPQGAQWAIIRDGNSFKLCSISNKDDDASAIVLGKTAQTGVYLYQRTFYGSNTVAKANAVISSGGLLEYSYEFPEDELRYSLKEKHIEGVSIIQEIKMIKLYPSLGDIQKFAPSSGTGFAISSDGYIVTNYHVINGATNINVRGINGDFSKTFKAKIIVEDKNNDLAIIKIDDYSFSSLGAIPYLIQSRTCDVGSSIFCMGYPLRATMGDEVKLTNGIISSKSGFKGDITTYQITAPVQPGNSGGPLFDDKGNLIGIINAKHLGAENVSYAIKTSYLMNLIDIMPSTPKFQTINTLAGKTLAEQVKIIKNYTYIIETN
jgi:S1-C subfamily serine protease